VIEVLLGRPWRLPRLLLAVPALLGYPLGLSDRGRLKAAVLRAACGGLHREEVDRLAQAYVARVARSRLLSDALQAIAAHRAAGDHLVLMSASPDIYVPRLAATLGFDESLCTRLSWRAERFEGRLIGANCRGAAKLHCLERLREAHPGLPVTGYGNSPADLEHLSRCEEAVYVNARRAERLRLAALGLRTVEWR
jgi:phosphatidylglycerophosphatase C